MVLGSSPVAVTSPSDFMPASSKEFLDIQATIECGFTLKRVLDMTRTYSLRISVWHLLMNFKRISVWHLLMNFKNKYLLKKTVEVGQ